jgi:hypothetical protein
MITVITDCFHRARGKERKKKEEKGRERERNIARLYAEIHRHVGEA